MKKSLIGMAVLAAVQASSGFADESTATREIVCNDGALRVRENPIPAAERQWADYDVIAVVHNRGVVDYLLNAFGYGGDGGYGRTAYAFDRAAGILMMQFYGSPDARQTLNDLRLMTAGKFSGADLTKEGPGIRLRLSGAGNNVNWYFESCVFAE